MTANKEEMRELAAQLFAVVVATLPGPELKSKIQGLIKTAKDPHVSTETVVGILIVGYLILLGIVVWCIYLFYRELGTYFSVRGEKHCHGVE